MHRCLRRALVLLLPALLIASTGVVGHGISEPRAPSSLPELQETLRREVAARFPELRRSDPGPRRDALIRELAGMKRDGEEVFLRAVSETGSPRGGPAYGVASWPSNGLAVATGAALQFAPAVVEDGAGGAYVAWWEGAGATVLHLHRITGNGDAAPGWPAGGIALPASSGGAHLPGSTQSFSMIGDGVGGVYLAWEDTTVAEPIRLLRVDGTGALATGFPSQGVGLSGGAYADAWPRLVSDGGGGAIALWVRDTGEPAPWRLWAQRVDGSGTALWTAGGIPVSGTPVAAEMPAPVFVAETDGAGGALVGWITGSGSAADVMAQRLSGSGSVASGWPADGDTVCAAAGAQRHVRVAGDGGGGAFVAWTDERVEGSPRVRVTRQAASGGTAPGWSADGLQPVEEGRSQERPTAIHDGSGGVILGWVQPDSGPGNTAQILAHHVDASAFPVWPAPVVVAPSLVLPEEAPLAVGDGGYGAVYGWTSGLPAASAGDLFCQYLDWEGRPALPASGLPISIAAGTQILHALARTEIGVVFAVFTDHSGGSDADVFAMRVATRSDLNAAVYPSGWTQAIVARNAPAPGPGEVTPTDTLEGNAATTLVNWAYDQAGPNPMPGWSGELLLDDSVILSFDAPDSNVVGVGIALDVGPILVRGGRHTVTGVLDPSDEVPETNEGNNIWHSQWVWSPLAVPAGAPAVRSAPPPRGTTVYPNGDGFRFDRDPSRAWVVAAAGREPADDYDLYLYDDYSGSTSGFSNYLASSFLPSNYVEFVVGHGTGTPATLFPMVVRYLVDGGSDFILDPDDARDRAGNPDGTGTFPAQVLGGDRLAHVYDAYLEAGATYTFILNRLSGQTDLALRLFPGYSGGIHDPFGAAATAMPLDDLSDVLEYTATTTGWHPLLVHRPDASDAGEAVGYELAWKPGTVGVPPPGDTPDRLALLGAEANPLRGGGTLGFDLPEAGAVALAIYDVAGRRVRTLVEGRLDPGRHRVVWQGEDDAGKRVAPGVYYLELRAGGAGRSGRIVLLR